MTNVQMSSEAFQALGAPELVYIRPVVVRDIQAQYPGITDHYGLEETLFGIYGANGVQIAILPNRDEAFAEAVVNAFDPVSVH